MEPAVGSKTTNSLRVTAYGLPVADGHAWNMLPCLVSFAGVVVVLRSAPQSTDLAFRDALARRLRLSVILIQ